MRERTPGRMVDIYRSARRPDLYLYVPGRSTLDVLPEELVQQFGRPTRAMSLWLQPDTRLARASAAAVLAALEEKGWYLQMPSGDQTTEEALAALAGQLTQARRRQQDD